MYSQPGIRANNRYAQSSPPRPCFFRVTTHPFFGGLDPSNMRIHTVELCRNLRPPQHVDPHPDPAGGAHAVCPRTQTTDEATPVLSSAKWPMELVLVANAKGRKTFICPDRIRQILSPAVRTACLLTPGQTLFFPTPHPIGDRIGGRLTPPPRRPLPTRPATPVQTSSRGQDTPPNQNLPATLP
jgi:hypothetical protein